MQRYRRQTHTCFALHAPYRGADREAAQAGKVRIELIVIALGLAALLPLFLIASASPAERQGVVGVEASRSLAGSTKIAGEM